MASRSPARSAAAAPTCRSCLPPPMPRRRAARPRPKASRCCPSPTAWKTSPPPQAMPSGASGPRARRAPPPLAGRGSGGRAAAERRLPGRELRLAEQNLLFLLRHRPAPLVFGEHRDAALHGRTRGDRIVPAFHVGIVGQVDPAPVGVADPGEGADVGHAVFAAREERRLAEPL